MDRVKHLLLASGNSVFNKDGISVCFVKDIEFGIEIAKQILYKIVDKKTLLFLSGGKTPKDLYLEISKEKKLNPGGVAMVDERFGEKGHKNSNEKMIKEAGLISYLKSKRIPFYPILASDLRGREALDLVGRTYEKTLRDLFLRFEKKVAILGIGGDGHTAGIPSRGVLASDLRGREAIDLVGRGNKESLVLEYNDEDGVYGERITLTFLALSMLDLIIVLVFGKEKKKALELMFKKGSIKEIPARFYKKGEIAKKTLLITDQKI